jgi:hypothetical protein
MSYSPARVEDNAKPDLVEKQNLAPGHEPPIPSWFGNEVEPVKPDLMADRYRERLVREQALQRTQDEELEAYRRKLDEKFKTAKRLYDHPVDDKPSSVSLEAPEVKLRARRPTLPIGAIAAQGERYVREKPVRPERAKAPTRIGTYAAYAAMAMAIGGAAGFGFANRAMLTNLAMGGIEHSRQWLAEVSRPLPESATVQAAATIGGSTTLSKKTISMASLSVNDVRGTLNSMIPLTLSATPADASQPIDLMISGLPSSAYLTAGQQSADGSWIVKSPDVPNLRLVVAQSESPKLDLEVAAVEQTSGSLAAPAQRMQVELSDVKITPVSAPPDGQNSNVVIKPAQDLAADAGPKAAAIPVPVAAPGADLLVRADALMGQGDVVSARQIYMRAASQGNGKGAFGVARSYDPKVFAELKIEGLQPDAAKAADWYKKAAAAGVTSMQ